MNTARIIHLDETPSTMLEAAKLAAAGEPHGTIVVAERQTSGFGRHGHSWHSEDDGGLYFSVILRAPIPPEDLPVLTMALGLAAQSAVNDYAQVSADLRWPNDLLLNEKKLAGILVQSSGHAQIAGIGLNVNQKAFPKDLGNIATSLLIETGHEHSKAALLDHIRTTLLPYIHILTDRGKQEIFRLFTYRSSYVAGRQVEVDVNGNMVRGITMGLDANGFLKVATPTGKIVVVSGGVRPV